MIEHNKAARPADGVVSTPLVDLYIQLCAAHGIPRDTLISRSGVSERDLNPADGWVRQPVLERLFYARLANQPEPLLGMHFATGLDPSRNSVGLLGFLCMSCPSIQDLHYSLAHFGRLISNIFSTSLVHEPGAVLWCIDLLYREEVLIRDNVEWFLASCAQLIHKMDKTALQEVHLAHPPLRINGAPHPQYEKAFPCPVRFGQKRSALLLDPQSLNRKSPSGDVVVFNTLCKQAETLIEQMGPDLHLIDRVKQEIRDLLLAGIASRDEVCRRIGISSRHLHRQLQSYNTSYQSLLDEIRSETALKKLSDRGADIDQLSAELGFSGAKSFARWFQGRFGTTPGTYIRSL